MDHLWKRDIAKIEIEIEIEIEIGPVGPVRHVGPVGHVRLQSNRLDIST